MVPITIVGHFLVSLHQTEHYAELHQLYSLIAAKLLTLGLVIDLIKHL